MDAWVYGRTVGQGTARFSPTASPGGVVERGGQQQRAAVIVDARGQRARVPRQRRQLCSALQVPDHRDVVAAAGRELHAVRAERNVRHVLLVALRGLRGSRASVGRTGVRVELGLWVALECEPRGSVGHIGVRFAKRWSWAQQGGAGQKPLVGALCALQRCGEGKVREKAEVWTVRGMCDWRG
eukprot:365441-Chlamydomonas_euryale.AAC.23